MSTPPRRAQQMRHFTVAAVAEITADQVFLVAEAGSFKVVWDERHAPFFVTIPRQSLEPPSPF